VERARVLLVTGDAAVDHRRLAAPCWPVAGVPGRASRHRRPARWDRPDDVRRMGRRGCSPALRPEPSTPCWLTTPPSARSAQTTPTPRAAWRRKANRACIVYSGLIKAGSRPSGRHRRDRGVASPYGALRFLERLRAQVRPSGLQGGPPGLRHGERAVLEACVRLRDSRGARPACAAYRNGVHRTREDAPAGASIIRLPSFEEILSDPRGSWPRPSPWRRRRAPAPGPCRLTRAATSWSRAGRAALHRRDGLPLRPPLHGEPHPGCAGLCRPWR